MQSPSPATLGLIALLALLAWRVYARLKRIVGRQRLSRMRPWITLAVFPLLGLLVGYGARAESVRLGWLAAGLLLGAVLALYGLARTRFEATPQGLFYTPNAHVGVVLSLLVVARVVYRLVEVYVDPAAPREASAFARSSLTLAVFGLLAGYFVIYAAGLLRWRWRVLAATRRGEGANGA